MNNADFNTPAVMSFLSKIKESKAATHALDYGRNGRLGDLVQDITDPPESDGERRFTIEWHSYSRYVCHSLEQVLVALEEIRERVLKEDSSRLLVTEDFYAEVASQMEWQVERAAAVHPVIANAYATANEVRGFASEVVTSLNVDSRMTERFALTTRADEAYAAAVNLTGDPDFWIDISRHKKNN